MSNDSEHSIIITIINNCDRVNVLLTWLNNIIFIYTYKHNNLPTFEYKRLTETEMLGVY